MNIVDKVNAIVEGKSPDLTPDNDMEMYKEAAQELEELCNQGLVKRSSCTLPDIEERFRLIMTHSKMQ